MIPVTNPAPGWYAISHRPPLLRWWTGAAWSDALVARGSSVDAHQTTMTLLRRVRVVTIGFWILTGLWAVLAVVMTLSGGYGPLPLLMPVVFIAGASFWRAGVPPTAVCWRRMRLRRSAWHRCADASRRAGA